MDFNSGRAIENQLLLNDGAGDFSDANASNLGSVSKQGSSFTIRFFDIEILDVNAGGRDDIYFCYRSGTDQLYIRN